MNIYTHTTNKTVNVFSVLQFTNHCGILFNPLETINVALFKKQWSWFEETESAGGLFKAAQLFSGCQ